MTGEFNAASLSLEAEATGELTEPSMIGGWTWWTEDPEPSCIPAHNK